MLKVSLQVTFISFTSLKLTEWFVEDTDITQKKIQQAPLSRSMKTDRAIATTLVLHQQINPLFEQLALGLTTLTLQLLQLNSVPKDKLM